MLGSLNGSASEVTILPRGAVLRPTGRKILQGVGNNVDGVKWQRQRHGRSRNKVVKYRVLITKKIIKHSCA
jgi:hypothetical protein